MEHKYNQLSIERYSASLAKILCDRYFTNNQAITGQQLVSFCPVKQVNLFVIQELLFRWNQEMAHLKSPYFDFENDEVKDALVQFMNVLSRKILIKRPHFEPLLSQAITDTLEWVLNPAKVFEEKFLKAQDEISGVKLQTHLKYIQINKDYIKGFLEGLAWGVLPYGNVLNQFKTYLLRNSPDPQMLDNLINEFNALSPLQKSDLLSVAPINSVVAEVFSPVSEFNDPEPLPAPEPAFVPVAELPKPVIPAPQPVTPAPSYSSPEPVPTTIVREPVAANNNPLNERFRLEKPTLNERLAKSGSTTLAESPIGVKIESLRESISINQRFSFINELFKGENMEYHNVIKKLDEYSDAESAKNYVTQDLAYKYNWSKKEEEHVNKLLRLIDRKFS